jgi:SAM-dependent methyltransferase
MPTTSDPHSHADRAASFTRGAAIYAQVRPSYPSEVVSWLVPPGARVLDLGAGTGLLTAPLMAAGHEVVAVDPSSQMLAELCAALPDVEARVGTAEAVPLPDGSVDAVVVGQAWHWFDEPHAAAEIARVLRPGGTLGVCWNNRDERVDWVRQFGGLLHDGDRLQAPGSQAPEFGPSFTTPEDATFRWSQRMPTRNLRDLAASRSYLLTLDHDARERHLLRIDDLVATHPDLAAASEVALPYVTSAYRAVRR